MWVIKWSWIISSSASTRMKWQVYLVDSICITLTLETLYWQLFEGTYINFCLFSQIECPLRNLLWPFLQPWTVCKARLYFLLANRREEFIHNCIICMQITKLCKCKYTCKVFRTSDWRQNYKIEGNKYRLAVTISCCNLALKANVTITPKLTWKTLHMYFYCLR